MPFTTPALRGARLRRSARGGCELVVPAPHGARGDYVLEPDRLDTLCRATLHDRRLAAALAALPALTPHAVRECAWLVAAEGFAGPAARSAAAAARQADKEDAARARAVLLDGLIARTHAEDGSAAQMLADLRAADLRRRSLEGGTSGIMGDGLARTVSEIAAVLSPVGIGAEAERARLPRLAGAVEMLGQDARECAERGRGEHLDVVEGVAIAAEAAAARTRLLLDAARGQAHSSVALIGQWLSASEQIVDLAQRPAWVLDGWEQLILLWNTVRNGADWLDTVGQVAPLLPVLPEEADAWCAQCAAGPLPVAPRKPMAAQVPPRSSGKAFEHVARNEEMRAMAA
ncbi:MAG: hypothetical protein JSR21_07945 [Proteobacteria bacterium]|nr:hypothetical protein [Pseudomonadota bacterium]